MKRYTIIIALLLIFKFGFSQTVINKDFKKFFDKYELEGCFVLLDVSKNEYIMYNSHICNTEFIPASTFKIPNSVIAIEEGVIKDTNEIIKWDGNERYFKSWNQDQTLKTAMKFSCVWVYQKFAEQIGIDNYKKYINDFDYGNKVLTAPVNLFWLQGDFAITAVQQVNFLKKFYYYELPVDKNSIDIVKDIIILEQTDNYKISGKTGTAKINDTDYIFWLVGYIEKDGKPYFYALNYISPDFEGKTNARHEIVRSIFRDLELID